MTRAFSGRAAGDLTTDSLARDELSTDDVRIHPETLLVQADVAERHGNPQLAGNFRRAAELTQLTEAQVMALYEALRPHRSSSDEIARLAQQLDEQGAPLCAALVREAAEVYVRRDLLA